MKKLCKVAAVGLLSAAVVSSMAGTALAQDAWWTSGSAAAPSTAAEAVTPAANLLTTYGVRAGSAGGDYIGISNTNFDYCLTNQNSDGTGTMYDYTQSWQNSTKEKKATFSGYMSSGLAIWASAANENANPYYRNLLINVAIGAAPGSASAVSGAATTWTTNSNSWGDLNGSDAAVLAAQVANAKSTGYIPNIVFGAVKNTNWSNFDPTATNWYKQGLVTDTTAYANNDATNIWTQVYSIGQLAVQANSYSGKVTRYNNSDATVSAVDYEKCVRGNLLYIASKIDSGAAKKKTIAYLYAIDETAGTMYFFTPTADGLTTGNDTNGAATSTETAADTNYASNNSTINMGYMGVLPYISNTFDSGNTVKGGITMKVEDIFKSNPACTVSTSDMSALKDVDIIFFNTNTALTAKGTSNGQNSNGIINTGTYAKGITASNLKALLNGVTSAKLIGADDFGTSSKQPAASATATAVDGGMSPLLYCTRNYTADKDVRAVWCFSQAYPELYDNNPYASYAYWVNKIYHIQTAYVPAVVKYMTLSSNSVWYTETTAANMETKFYEGYNWWTTKGYKSASWGKYAYYNGSSRASWYSGDAASEEPVDKIGIFQPSALWTATMTQTQAIDLSTTYKAYKKTTLAKKAYSFTSTVYNAQGTLAYTRSAAAKKVGITVTFSGKKATVKVKKGTKKGTYYVYIYAKATTGYTQSAKKAIKIVVK